MSACGVWYDVTSGMAGARGYADLGGAPGVRGTAPLPAGDAVCPARGGGVGAPGTPRQRGAGRPGGASRRVRLYEPSLCVCLRVGVPRVCSVCDSVCGVCARASRPRGPRDQERARGAWPSVL